MKKLIVLTLMLVLSSCIQAQWFGKKIKGDGNVITKTRQLDDYDKISVAGSFDVKLVSGKEGKITIKMDENLFEYLITEVKDDKLKIKWEKGINVSTKKDILITVPFEDIEAVSLAGSGDVFNHDVIKSDTFKSSLAGSGDISLKLDVNSLTSSISGSGDIEIVGNAQSLTCSIAGSGDFKGVGLNTKDVTISIAGSGDVKVDVSENLKVRIAGSGDVHYKGNPKQDVKISGSGSVTSF